MQWLYEIHRFSLFPQFFFFLVPFLPISQTYGREGRPSSLPRAQYLDVLRITKEPDAQLELLMPLPPYNQASWPATAGWWLAFSFCLFLVPLPLPWTPPTAPREPLFFFTSFPFLSRPPRPSLFSSVCTSSRAVTNKNGFGNERLLASPVRGPSPRMLLRPWT